ncbi:uncharacterized protein LOC128553974 [Mercenaria mercenaria]|uniref:uncharacterized protein LOC128553974 n=1 Tax=Mercenaria mercenaria TaxID=6596 RepID=UPI00234F5A5F|nr:uncharacterized protein LOC128553974 [Mercenaria mercenaria]
MADIERRVRRIRNINIFIRVDRRFFKDRSNPLEVLSRDEVRERYRFFPETIVYICGLLDLARPTQRSQPLLTLLTTLVSLHYFATNCHHIVTADFPDPVSAEQCLSLQTNYAGECKNLFLSLKTNKHVKDSFLILQMVGVRTGSRYVSNTGIEGSIDTSDRTFLYRSKYRSKANYMLSRGRNILLYIFNSDLYFIIVVGFPNVVGVVDGTQIRIQGPTEHEEDYVNRKGFHSINVQMICDARFMILDDVAKWPGSVHDSRIFRDSEVGGRLERGEIDSLLLGDSGYPCRKYLMTPYHAPQTHAQERFNESLCKTRVVVEQSFGVMKRRFPCLSYGLRVSPPRACKITVSCVILHNMVYRGMKSMLEWWR